MSSVIFFDATPYWANKPTGAGRYVVNLLSQLSELDQTNRYRVFGFEDRLPQSDKWADNFKYEKISISNWMGPLAIEIARRRYAFKATAGFPTSILHCNLDPIPIYKSNVKTVLMLYDVMRINPDFQAHWRPSMRDRARTWLRYSKAKKCDALLTISDYSKNQIKEKLLVPPDKITVTRLGAEPKYKPGKADPKVLKSLGVKTPFILFVGEFGRQKNEGGLIKAFLSAIKKESMDKDISLVLVGDSQKLPDPLMFEIDKSSARDRIKLVGNVNEDELVSLYRSARLFVLPSFDEGFGLPALEAMSCGTPVIGSNAGSLPEIIGDAGELVNPNSIKEIEDAIVSFSLDEKKRRKLSGLGLKRSKMFSFKSVAEKTLEVYRYLSSESE